MEETVGKYQLVEMKSTGAGPLWVMVDTTKGQCWVMNINSTGRPDVEEWKAMTPLPYRP